MTLSCTNIACQRGDNLLFHSLNMQIAEGECVWVDGHNGCGKTTLLKTLATLRQPDAGIIKWQQQPIQEQLEHYRSALFWMGHLEALKYDLSLLENVKFSLALRGQSENRDKIQEACEMLSLSELENVPVRMLSQGQKKKVLWLNLMLSKSQLWLLDEPFVGLDRHTVALLRQYIEDHVRQSGMVVLTTHQTILWEDIQLRVLNLAEYVSADDYYLDNE